MMTRNQNEIHAEWLENESRDNLKFVLTEYRFLVGRFVQWLGLTLGKSSDERARQLLLHNLVDECGQIDGPRSHLSLLDACLTSCGIVMEENCRHLPTTRSTENWFFDVFSNQDCHTCLSVLGPGTESISQQFLKPLEAGIRKAFAGEAVDYAYFDVHRPEVEVFHAEDIDKAIELVERSVAFHEVERLQRARQFWSIEAIHQHSAFWNSLRAYLHHDGSLRERSVIAH